MTGRKVKESKSKKREKVLRAKILSDVAKWLEHHNVPQQATNFIASGKLAISPNPKPFRGIPDFKILFGGASKAPKWSTDRALNPHMTYLLWFTLTALGGEIEDPDSETFVSLYPRIVREQGAVWRKRAAQCYFDLALDLATGGWPEPRCTGEEVALWLALEQAENQRNDMSEFLVDVLKLPVGKKHYDFDLLTDSLYQDHDFRLLYDNGLDGIEDSNNEINKAMGMGPNLQADNWFEFFDNMNPRG